MMGRTSSDSGGGQISNNYKFPIDFPLDGTMLDAAVEINSNDGVSEGCPSCLHPAIKF